ncbi:hypothetical protein PISL3812_06948 [Talaromyces islandicus]|uniref:Uncharacterized protein n=1 Tax=Talaromyces islandicus TaxID=28573 RepID=A0A0U1M2W2_TALIS|nr:hypothetical protein PISL3812_06948 [Talaromyces islandicus]
MITAVGRTNHLLPIGAVWLSSSIVVIKALSLPLGFGPGQGGKSSGANTQHPCPLFLSIRENSKAPALCQAVLKGLKG